MLKITFPARKRELEIEEIWKNINGFSKYEVSNLGNIRTKRKQINFIFTPDKDGYSKTALYNDNGVRKYLRVHRVVAMSFIENIDDKPVVNHKNGIKNDNRVENLEWNTISENTLHGFRELNRKSPITNEKPIKLIDITTEEILIFKNQRLASEFLGISECNIGAYFKRKERLGGRAKIAKKYYAEKVI